MQTVYSRKYLEYDHFMIEREPKPQTPVQQLGVLLEEISTTFLEPDEDGIFQYGSVLRPEHARTNRAWGRMSFAKGTLKELLFIPPVNTTIATFYRITPDSKQGYKIKMTEVWEQGDTIEQLTTPVVDLSERDRLLIAAVEEIEFCIENIQFEAHREPNEI